MTPLNYISEAQSWDFLDSLNVGLINLSVVPQYSKVIIVVVLKTTFIIIILS